MKKSILIIAIVGLVMNFSFAQKFLCRDGHVWFFSTTPVENIEAHNKQASAILDTETGEIVVSVLMKSFEFERALMQEHFNENYVESDKFPKGKFTGKISNLSEIDFKKPGTYTAQVKGVLNIHGVDKEIETPIELRVDGDKIQAKGKFVTAAEDFKIEIPSVVKDKIAKQIDVNLDMGFSPYKK